MEGSPIMPEPCARACLDSQRGLLWTLSQDMLETDRQDVIQTDRQDVIKTDRQDMLKTDEQNMRSQSNGVVLDMYNMRLHRICK